MKTVDYLAAVKQKLNLSTDYKLAKALGVPSNLVSKYQSGKNIPGPLTCFKIAEILGDQPAAVIADLELERAEKTAKDQDADEWKGLIKKLGGAAMSILLAAGLGGFSNADAHLQHSQNDANNTHRIKSKKRTRRASPWVGLMPAAAVAA